MEFTRCVARNLPRESGCSHLLGKETRKEDLRVGGGCSALEIGVKVIRALRAPVSAKVLEISDMIVFAITKVQKSLFMRVIANAKITESYVLGVLTKATL